MSTIPAFSGVVVGRPLQHANLAVFPLFASGHAESDVDYELSDEAIAAGTVVVEEVSESGSVPTLRVTNKGARRVLFLEGQELEGAKQNRVLNTSLLVGAGARATIPVSCVEQGRWRHRSRSFAASGHHCSPSLRKSLKRSVARSLDEGKGHASDQMEVWAEVGRQMDSLGSSSETMAMSDTFRTFSGQIDEYRQDLAYADGAVGLAVAIGPDVVAIDLFDRPSTCRKVWDRLLSGFVMDALERPGVTGAAGPADVLAALQRLASAMWRESPPVGEGQEFRAKPGPDAHASALTFSASLLHGSAVLA
ncbi:hypothetical protein OJF2_23600 [Aquisphaera giovannonii]|uniref:ARG and Rhodanese-Phosphatase-superfamily-associated domain-containing protein n=1 Tax=Aquisphaera giovannonii TaxID=406548 RepID=A0A5B9W1H7_9BACT|nr:DUF6569 family protein [Aquisphaera giovannonii]QEH33830.1 hypothetical protein OJF2_23600 [Aquisphaera giovannonii]